MTQLFQTWGGATWFCHHLSTCCDRPYFCLKVTIASSSIIALSGDHSNPSALSPFIPYWMHSRRQHCFFFLHSSVFFCTYGSEQLYIIIKVWEAQYIEIRTITSLNVWRIQGAVPIRTYPQTMNSWFSMLPKGINHRHKNLVCYDLAMVNPEKGIVRQL